MLSLFGSTGVIAQDVAFLQKYAEKGDTDAMHQLANCYYEGKGGLKKDPVTAMYWYEKAAKKGKAESQFMAAYCYLAGEGVKADFQKSQEYANKAKNKRYAPAYWLYAQYYKHNYLTSPRTGYIQNLSRSAELGYSKAQAEIGALYLYGADEYGVTRNINTALGFFNKSAEQGDPAGEYYLGVCYELGAGVDKDSEKALQYYNSAAQKDYAAAKARMGYAYLIGEGVSVDYSTAYNYLYDAANEGNAYAIGKLADMYYYGVGVEENNNTAIDLYKKGVELGDAYCMTQVATMYLYGYGASVDYNLTYKYYSMAAEKNDPTGQCGVGLCYMDGYGVTKNPATAFSWFKKAADQDDAYGQWNVAKCYYFGEGVTKNSSQYFSYLSKAANNGYVEAMTQLGYEYCSGENVPGKRADYEESLKWYNKAAARDDAQAQAFLGNAYFDGSNPAPAVDYDRAFAYLSDAIKNDEFSQLDTEVKVETYRRISQCYRYGRGTDANQALASYYEGEVTKLGGGNLSSSGSMFGGNRPSRNDSRDSEKIVIIESNVNRSSYGTWQIQSIEVLPDKTLVEMTITPSQAGVSVWYNSDGEFIEDAETGQKYRMISGTLGYDNNHATTIPTTRPYEFTLTFEVLSKSVRYVNICSGDHYYVRNLRIR